jgi:hypothetical protein
MRIVAAAAAVVCVLAASAADSTTRAATITQTINFSASGFSSQTGHKPPKDPVTGSFTFTLDDTKKYTDQAAGLKLGAMNIAVQGPAVFSYDPSQKLLIVGANGRANPYIWGTNDFSISVFLKPSLNGGFFGYSQQGIHDSFETYRIALSASSPTARTAAFVATAVTPIPGSIVMLMTALGALGVAARMRHKQSAAAPCP